MGRSSSPDDGLRGRVTTTVDLILLSASGRLARLLAAAPLPAAKLFFLFGEGDRLTDSLDSGCLWRTLCLRSLWEESLSDLGGLEEEEEGGGGYASCW